MNMCKDKQYIDVLCVRMRTIFVRYGTRSIYIIQKYNIVIQSITSLA